jgi:hypothetical protein
LSSLRSPCRKSDALKLQIKRQLAVKHCRYLGTQCRWDELAEYHDAMKAGENGLPPQELFDAIDRRMRASGWDDMRWLIASGGFRDIAIVTSVDEMLAL